MEETYATDNLFVAAYLYSKDKTSLLGWKFIRERRGKKIYEFTFSHFKEQYDRVREYSGSQEKGFLDSMDELRFKAESESPNPV